MNVSNSFPTPKSCEVANIHLLFLVECCRIIKLQECCITPLSSSSLTSIMVDEPLDGCFDVLLIFGRDGVEPNLSVGNVC